MAEGNSSSKFVWKNILWGIKTVYSVSHRRVRVAFIKEVFGYFLWVFYSAYFIRFVIDTIQEQKPLKEVLVNIAIIGIVSMSLTLYKIAAERIIIPIDDIKVHKAIYKMIHKKSENVGLHCFEDVEFYDNYSAALDCAGNQLSECVNNVGEVFGGFLAAILASVAMIKIDPIMIFFVGAALIGNLVLAPKANKLYYERYQEGIPFDRRTNYVNRVMYLAKYAKELRMYSITNVLNDMHKDATNGKSSLWKKFFSKAFILGILRYLFSYMFIFEGILIYGSYRAIVSQTLSFSELAILTSLMITVSWVWIGIIDLYNAALENGFVISKLKSFLEYKETVPEDFEGIEPDPHIESIEFQHVSFSYDGERKSLDDVSFVINDKEKIALVGLNGSGKTTLIKLLLRMYDPTEGKILVNGTDIREYTIKSYRALFACAFQDFQIFAGDIKNNVLMGKDGSDKDVIEALKQAGIYDKVSGFPQGINTNLTKEFNSDGENLSGGESQKLACARVFFNKGKVALFDEPSSALDPISENELFRSIISYLKTGMGIMISHRLSCVKDVDRIIMMKNGKIIEEGDHTELMRQKGDYYSMYRTQEKNYYTYDMVEEAG